MQAQKGHGDYRWSFQRIFYERYLPKITDADMKLISEPLDIYGQNIYNGRCFRMGPDGKPQEVTRPFGAPKTAVGWPVTPECIYWGLKYLDERYHMPMYLTENGMACHDCISLDGKVHDPNRIDFLARYLKQVKRAASEMDLPSVLDWCMWTLPPRNGSGKIPRTGMRRP